MKEFYLLGSIFIGLVSTYDGYMLCKARGQALKNKLIALTSTVEFFWALLTFYVLFTVNFSSIEILIPTLFAIHNIFGWIYSILFLKPPKSDELEDMLDFTVPRWYSIFGLCFGVVFTVSSLLVATLY